MNRFNIVTGTMAPLPINDIDTDQIIPAQYLKVTTKEGLVDGLFQSWRYLPDGEPRPSFVLNQPAYQNATLLLAGDNFGCGSSREHAPWALSGYGFRAIISTSFADIFHNNALKNGLLPLIVDEATHKQLLSLAQEDPTTSLTIDLESQTLMLPDGRGVTFPIDNFSKQCMLRGVDQLGYLLTLEPQIAIYEETHAK